MGQRTRELWRRGGLGLLATTGLLSWYSCGGEDITEPPTASLTVLTTTFGLEPDPDGFTVNINDRVQTSIPTGGSLHQKLPAGIHIVTLAGIAPNCDVGGANPQTVELSPGDNASVRFTIGCSGSSTGILEIRTQTTGPSPDPDGYTISLNGGARQTVGVNASLTNPRASVGAYTLLLEGVAANCSLDGSTSREAVVTVGQQTTVTFSINCPAASTHTGIMFGMVELETALLNQVQTGTWRAVTPETILAELSAARARGARLILRLARGDRQLLNPDGTFSMEKWRSSIQAYRNVDFSEYIDDGTVVGHYLIDEPHLTRRWGRGIPHDTVEAMARLSKQLWPGLTTMARALPSWLSQAPFTWTHLDAGWVQYHSRRGDPATWLAGEVAIAKRLGLGAVTSMNALDGGTSASGIPGYSDDQFAMSADELRRFGTAMLRESYGCAFLLWMYTPDYYGRPDIQSAIADLSQLARNHPSTSCRQ